MPNSSPRKKKLCGDRAHRRGGIVAQMVKWFKAAVTSVRSDNLGLMDRGTDIGAKNGWFQREARIIADLTDRMIANACLVFPPGLKQP